MRECEQQSCSSCSFILVLSFPPLIFPFLLVFLFSFLLHFLSYFVLTPPLFIRLFLFSFQFSHFLFSFFFYPRLISSTVAICLILYIFFSCLFSSVLSLISSSIIFFLILSLIFWEFPTFFSFFLCHQDEDTASRSDVEAYGNVYSSASSMFVFIKNSIKRCTALSNGQVRRERRD